MGWSTTVIAPPDGNMSDYMASLALLLERADQRYFPAHGPSVEQPRRHVRALVTHRRMREKQILERLGSGVTKIADLVRSMYQGIDPRLHLAAGRSVLAHLIDLEQRGLVAQLDDQWSPVA
jgi:glyoxylase-like metal-dependent hydrolase (beta-lactamase superfamily II)